MWAARGMALLRPVGATLLALAALNYAAYGWFLRSWMSIQMLGSTDRLLHASPMPGSHALSAGGCVAAAIGAFDAAGTPVASFATWGDLARVVDQGDVRLALPKD